MGTHKRNKMAIQKSLFIQKVDIGLRADKTYTQFYFRFRIEDKDYSKLFNYSDKAWDKKTRIAKAKFEALEYKEYCKNKLLEYNSDFDENATLNQIAKAYFTTECSQTNWTKEKEDAYRLYIQKTIGNKKVTSIRLHDINKIRTSMEKKGFTKQTENGCSPRTIKKVLIQTLKPIIQYAYDNKIINSMPKIELSKRYTKENKAKKKKVSDAGKKLAKLYDSIHSIYAENPFYRALFLFALYGRRWGEIKTLEWDDIFLDKKLYRIKAQNNKINEEQFFDLPEPISLSLLDMPSSHEGLIFQSPITGKTLSTPKKQLAKIKEYSNIEELTMHYFRHILVSAMGEMGTASTILSAALGHTNLNTVNQFYLSANYTKGSQVANDAIKQITQNSFD